MCDRLGMGPIESIEWKGRNERRSGVWMRASKAACARLPFARAIQRESRPLTFFSSRSGAQLASRPKPAIQHDSSWPSVISWLEAGGTETQAATPLDVCLPRAKGEMAEDGCGPHRAEHRRGGGRARALALVRSSDRRQGRGNGRFYDESCVCSLQEVDP